MPPLHYAAYCCCPSCLWHLASSSSDIFSRGPFVINTSVSGRWSCLSFRYDAISSARKLDAWNFNTGYVLLSCLERTMFLLVFRNGFKWVVIFYENVLNRFRQFFKRFCVWVWGMHTRCMYINCQISHSNSYNSLTINIDLVFHILLCFKNSRSIVEQGSEIKLTDVSFLSVWNLVTIAAERYLAVCCPFKHVDFTTRRVKFIFFAIYILSVPCLSLLVFQVSVCMSITFYYFKWTKMSRYHGSFFI